MVLLHDRHRNARVQRHSRARLASVATRVEITATTFEVATANTTSAAAGSIPADEKSQSTEENDQRGAGLVGHGRELLNATLQISVVLCLVIFGETSFR